MIPRANAEAIARRFPDGAAFLATLEDRLAEVAQRWSLTLLDPLPIGIGGYLVGARTMDGREAVLKLTPADVELEAYALRRWAGEGAAALLAVDTELGALLLERCVPGATIDSLDDAQMLRAGCALARRLHRVPDAEDRSTLPRAEDAHGALVVCHGDMNPGNLLSHNRGWVAVDPLPLLAEPAYDAVSLG